MDRVGTITRTQAVAWGEEAANRLHRDWLGRVWHVERHGALLVDADGNVVRLVSAALGNGAFYLVLDEGAPPLDELLSRNIWAWRVDNELWVGDCLTVRLPDTAPWRGDLRWGECTPAAGRTALVRRIHWLADEVLARAPEGSFAGAVPDVLAGREPGTYAYLDGAARLMRWRAARVVYGLMPALEEGNMVMAEELANRAAGLGPGTPPAGDQFLIGLIAGLRLWEDALAPSGLKLEPVIRRMMVGAADRTSLLGWTLIQHALLHTFCVPWHDLYYALRDDAPSAHQRRLALQALGRDWLARPDALGSSGLAGFLLPLLWHQRKRAPVL